MYKATQLESKVASPSKLTSMRNQRPEERRFCPSMFCFTDEIVVRRISPQAKVWLLTDEYEDASWMMMGGEPTCPHCGTALLSVDGLR